jgi:hypothetical protein
VTAYLIWNEINKFKENIRFKVDMFARYRSYTSYSEENGKLIPAKEPEEKDVKYELDEKLVLVPLETGKKMLEEYEKKLKSDTDKKESSPSAK